MLFNHIIQICPKAFLIFWEFFENGILVIFGHFHTIIFRATCGDIRWIKDPKNAAVRCIILSLLSALTWNWPILRHFGTVSNSGILLKDFQESSQNCSIFTNFSQHTLQPFVHNVRKFQASSSLPYKIVEEFPGRPRNFGPKKQTFLVVYHLTPIVFEP